jgi:hypothetical protein
VRDHRAELDRAEHVGNHHHFAWLDGQPTEVAPTFDRLASASAKVADGGTLVEWPSLEIVTD